MRTIRFDPTGLNGADGDWWKEFLDKAEPATAHAIDAWEKWLGEWLAHPAHPEFDHDFKQPIWSELKHWLYGKVFHGKCAYCESTLELDRYLGDAEHFRPKGRVTRKGNIEVVRERVRVKLWNGKDLDHPGYFWLAYDWRNLMPACSGCNSGAAKVDQFPSAAACVLMVPLSRAEVAAQLAQPIASKVFPGLYYLSPADLDRRERPLLLNPLNPPEGRDPERHLQFGLAGSVRAKPNGPGAHSIEVFKLDRDVLKRRRQEAQQNAYLKYCHASEKLVDPELNEQVIEEARKPFDSGVAEYSAACMHYIDDRLEAQFRAKRRRRAANGRSQP